MIKPNNPLFNNKIIDSHYDCFVSLDKYAKKTFVGHISFHAKDISTIALTLNELGLMIQIIYNFHHEKELLINPIIKKLVFYHKELADDSRGYFIKKQCAETIFEALAFLINKNHDYYLDIQKIADSINSKKLLRSLEQYYISSVINKEVNNTLKINNPNKI